MRTEGHPLSRFAQLCPLLRTLFRLTPGGVSARQTSGHLILKLQAIAHPYASIAQPADVGKTPSADLPHFGGTEMVFQTPIVGKSAEGVFPTSEGGAIDAYGWAIAWSVRKRRTELWRTLTPPGVSPNRVRKGGQSRANPLNGCALTQKVS